MRRSEGQNEKKTVELPQPKDDVVLLPQISNVASSGECTGLIPAAPADQEERESYQSLSSNALPKA